MHALAVGQAQRGHDVTVLVFAYDAAEPPFAGELAQAGVPCRVVRVSARGYLEERRASTAVIRELAPEVVHTHGMRVDVVTGPVPRSLGIPSVSTVHGRTGGNFKMRLYELAQYTSLSQRDAVIAVSRPLVRLLGRHGVRSERIHLIPNAWSPLPPGFSRRDSRVALGIDGLAADVAIVGFVGRLGREKGADVLIDAIAALRDPRVHAVIIGDGDQRAALEQLAARRGVTGRVHFRGTIPGAGRLLSAVDLFVLSSRTEGTPIALFEAIGAGVPVVATRVGGVPDVVTEREASLVPSEQPAALAAAIGNALADRDGTARRAAAATERLTANFALQPWLDRHDALYRALCRGVRRSRGQASA